MHSVKEKKKHVLVDGSECNHYNKTENMKDKDYPHRSESTVLMGSGKTTTKTVP